MNRRDFTSFLGGAVIASPGTVLAQQLEKVRRLAIVDETLQKRNLDAP